MMDKLSETIRCLVLGVVQGLTEFLPISSSFHLRLVPQALGWPEVGIVLSAFLHLGTLLAVVAYFSKDLCEVALEGWKALTIPGFSLQRFSQTLAFKIMIGSIPAVLLGFFLHDFFESIDNNFLLTTSCLIIVGILLWVSDLGSSRIASIDESLTWKQALLIGCGQALALIPGVSRSGATISTTRLIGFDRFEAARFSFLLGVPVIFGAGLFEIIKVFKQSAHLEVSLLSCLLGCLSSTVVGYLSIKFLLKFLQTHSLFPFMLYRIVLGGIVLSLLLKGTFK